MKLLWADQLKLKRSSLLIVVLLVPLLIIAYELVNLTYRSEYVENKLKCSMLDQCGCIYCMITVCYLVWVFH